MNIGVSQALLSQDKLARQEALDLSSFIVEAPAGSGKTELLVQRFLKLLATVDHPEEVLAITFTRKAASEMKARILKYLDAAANNISFSSSHQAMTCHLAHEVLRLKPQWHLDQQTHRLRVMTLDSLSRSLVTKMPLLSKMDVHLNILSEEEMETAFNEVARRVLDNLQSDSDLSQKKVSDAIFLALKGVDYSPLKLKSLLVEMLKNRDQWLPLIFGASEGCELLKKHFSEMVSLIFSHALPVSSLEKVLRSILPGAALNLSFGSENKDNKNELFLPLLEWVAPLEGQSDSIVLWQAIANMVLAQNGQIRKRLTIRQGFLPKTQEKKQMERCLEELAQPEQAAFVEALRVSLLLPSVCFSEQESEVLEAYILLLKLASAELRLLLNEIGKYDYIEIAIQAIESLGRDESPSDLALLLDYQLKHLLVDEFQDTNPMQLRLIERVTQSWLPDDGRTVFLVGDPMQSIYRFRKADVSIFLSCKEKGLGQLTLRSLFLRQNNRSSKKIVNWVNEVMPQAFPLKDDIAKGCVSYRPCLAEKNAQPGQGIQIKCLNRDDSYDQEEASQVCRWVEEIIEREKEINHAEPYRIAILVRAKAHARLIAQSLLLKNIPFEAIELESLYSKQIIQDLLSLTKALIHRADKVSWLAVLRSAWVGLKVHDLHYLLAEGEDQRTVWQIMQDDRRLDSLSEDARERLQFARQTFLSIFSRCDSLLFHDWIEMAWLEFGGPQCLLSKQEMADAQEYFLFLKSLPSDGSPDYDSLERALSYYLSDTVFPGQFNGRISIQIMTIHKAKGLEFDSVILPGLGKTIRSPNQKLILWEETSSLILTAPFLAKFFFEEEGDSPKGLYDFLDYLEKERNYSEMIRLFYVAVTRAKTALYLIGEFQKEGSTEKKMNFQSLLKEQLPFEQNAPLSAQEAGSFPKPVGPVYFVRAKQVSATVKSAGVSKKSDNQARQILQWPDQDSKLKGVLIHLYLCHIARLDLPEEELIKLVSEKKHQWQKTMKAWLVQQFFTKDKIIKAVEEMISVIAEMLKTEKGRWILKRHDHAKAEWELQTLSGTKRIDRFFIENNVYWIIDYKTGKTPSVQTEAEKKSQHRQLDDYANLFKDQIVKKGIYFTQTQEFHEL